MGVVVELETMTKGYGSLVAADAVSFEVAEGEIFGLLGRNGAGKPRRWNACKGCGVRIPDGSECSVWTRRPTPPSYGDGRRVAWELIRAVADRGTTVVLVTHFTDEAERLCDRVAVMNSGKLVALDTPRGLVNRYVPEMRVTFRSDSPDLSWLDDISVVRRVSRHGGRVEVEGIDPVLALVAAEMVNRGTPPVDLQVTQPTLEDASPRITGEPGEE